MLVLERRIVYLGWRQSNVVHELHDSHLKGAIALAQAKTYPRLRTDFHNSWF